MSEGGLIRHGLGGKVAPLLRPLADTDAPARVLDRLSGVGVIQHEEVTLNKGEEGGALTCESGMRLCPDSVVGNGPFYWLYHYD